VAFNWAGAGENALAALILAGIGYMVWAKMKGKPGMGKIFGMTGNNNDDFFKMNGKFK
jgi:hypothetical protein